jgi:hypothetical protein
VKTVTLRVLATPGRNAAHDRLVSSLEEAFPREAPIWADYDGWLKSHWFPQPEGMSAIEHWRATHLAPCDTDLILVLEDDAFVNRHLIHNIQTWRWPYDKDFGAGWLYNPGGYAGRDTWYTGPPAWHGTVAVLYPTELLPKLVERAWATIQTGEAWDLAISRAVMLLGKRIRVHFPALVEHQNDVPSIIQKGGNLTTSLRTSRGTFDREWRRPERHAHGIVDERGRRVV